VAYTEANLTPIDTTAVAWALAWTRFLLHDTDSSNEIYSDTELTAVLTAHAFVHEDGAGVETTYYRPHVAAAHLIATDPDRATSESLLGSSVTVQSPGSLARSIRSRNAWIDDAIEELTEERPPTGRTLTAVF
jgi:hypothetical protein